MSSKVHRMTAVVAVFSLSSVLFEPFASARQRNLTGAAATLARAWGAIAAGRPSEAIAAADELLKANPRDRRAVTVKVEALAAATPLQALDVYEAWLAAVPGEDVFLLEPIARGTLEAIALGGDAHLRLIALEALARSGVPGAHERLARDGSAPAELALARLGDPAAAARAIKTADFEQQRPEVRIEILSLSGPSAIDPMRRYLTGQSGAVRAAAVEALGRIGGDAVVEDLKAAAGDPEFHVRATANVALAKLGDQQAVGAVNEMLTSPVADIRLLAARAFADRGPGPWLEAILPLLDGGEGLVRLRAAELLAPFRPNEAGAALSASVKSANPVVRSEAVRVLATPALARAGAADLSALRRALRDADAAIRLHAAAAILAAFSPR